MGIILLLLDEKCSVINAFIPSAYASQFRHVLGEGVIFNVGGFEVGRCQRLYKITDHPYVIRFLPATSIEREKFMLRNFDDLQVLANTNSELPDVVGQICFVQGSNLNDSTSTQRLVVRYRMDTSVIVYLSLWDDVAATFRAHFSSGDTMNSVMLVTTVNPKMFGGNLYLNSTSATRFFFDTDIQPIKQFSNRMGIKSEEAFTRADTSAGIRKKKLVSIHELHEFISKSHEQTQDADFLCNAKVVGVVRKNGWSFVSCTGCSRKLDKVGNALRCNKCVSPTVTGVVRYRVELAVEDGHDRETFVVFDDEMTKLITKIAATLILEDGDGGNKDEYQAVLKT
ncbi:PREDICTED: probable replication factor A 73 kDa subunit isoform X2 [Camelina sativa]|nr:PREDICTED: probable replication factor A 73 kDa subunit isoform X2 [Camelina sativa]